MHQLDRIEKKVCFGTLAISKRYCSMAKILAADLKQYAPYIPLVVCTDLPEEFDECTNIIAFQHSQKGIFVCNNDKRFVIEKALSIFNTVIFIDADTRIIDKVPENIEFLPGITANQFKNIAEVKMNKERKQELAILRKLINKLNLSIEYVNWISPDLFAITKDRGKENAFIKEWETIARYIQLKAIHCGYLHREDGNSIGIAAAKVGLAITSEEMIKLRKIRKHEFVTSRSKKSETIIDKFVNKLYKLLFCKFRRWIGSPYRLSREILIALKDFQFYFR